MCLSDKSAAALFTLLLAVAALAFPACQQLATPPTVHAAKEADVKASNGDYIAAINLYEKALDGSPGSADIHYRLALLYDDKMNAPLNALHHFHRYLALAPTGRHAPEVKQFMQRDELAVVTSLSGDTIVTRAEAARLRNENLKLRQQLTERTSQLRAASQEKPARATRAERSPEPKRAKPKPRTSG
jgi:tetratricopeptide (TPR) repeat protein